MVTSDETLGIAFEGFLGGKNGNSGNSGVSSHTINLSDLESPLNLFSVPKTNTALLSSRIAEFFPIAPIEGADQFDFVVNPTGVEYLNLAGTRLAGRFKIVKVDARGKEYDLDEDDDISIVNMAPSSLFRLVTLKLNNVVVNDTGTFCQYLKDAIEKSLSNNQSIKRNKLKYTELYVEDRSGEEDINTKTGANAQSGYVIRRNFIKDSREIDFQSELAIDLLHCKTYLLPGIQLSLKCVRNDDEMTLLGPKMDAKAKVDNSTDKIDCRYKIKILGLRLQLEYVTLDPRFAKYHAEALERGAKALYNFPITRISQHLLPPGSIFHPIQHVATNILPNQIIFGFVNNSALRPSVNVNPLKFSAKTANLTELVVKVNGQRIKTFKMEYNVDELPLSKALEPYAEMQKILALDSQISPIDLSYEKWLSGLNFYVVDLTTVHHCNNYHRHPPMVGSLSVDVQMKTAHDDALCMLSLAIYNRTITIDVNRNVEIFDGALPPNITNIKI